MRAILGWIVPVAASAALFAGMGQLVGLMGGSCSTLCQLDVSLPLGALAGAMGHWMANHP